MGAFSNFRLKWRGFRFLWVGFAVRRFGCTAFAVSGFLQNFTSGFQGSFRVTILSSSFLKVSGDGSGSFRFVISPLGCVSMLQAVCRVISCWRFLNCSRGKCECVTNANGDWDRDYSTVVFCCLKLFECLWIIPLRHV